MKDPLDARQDPYQIFNEEAAAQGIPLLVSQNTPPMEIRRIFGRLRGRAHNPVQLEEARNQLTKTEYRMWTDIFYYAAGEGVELGEALAEPEWAWESVLVPELSEPDRLVRLILGDEERLLPPLREVAAEIKPMPHYDRIDTPEWIITFPR